MVRGFMDHGGLGVILECASLTPTPQINHQNSGLGINSKRLHKEQSININCNGIVMDF